MAAKVLKPSFFCLFFPVMIYYQALDEDTKAVDLSQLSITIQDPLNIDINTWNVGTMESEQGKLNEQEEIYKKSFKGKRRGIRMENNNQHSFKDTRKAK